MSKKLKVYLRAIEGASNRNAGVLKLFDLGSDGDRFKHALDLLDGDEEAFSDFVSHLQWDLHEWEDNVMYECFTLGTDFKIAVEVKDEEKDKTVLSSNYTFNNDTNQMLLEVIDDLEFGEDFHPLLKENILSAIANVKEGKKRNLAYEISKCLTYFSLDSHRSDPEVTDDHVYVGEVRHAEMDYVEFEIEIPNNEKFDKKKIRLFDGNFDHMVALSGYEMIPLLLYGHTLYLGAINLKEWKGEERYGLVKFKLDMNDKSYNVLRTGFGSPLADGKKYFVLDSTQIPEAAHKGDLTLTSFTVPNMVKKIGSYAFNNCENLVSIEIPSSVTEIGFSAFGGCKSLISLMIPDSVTTIGASAFEKCISLKSMNLPHLITKIDSNTFEGCSSLDTIVIPPSVTEIGYKAFNGCNMLKKIVIPLSVKIIEINAFNKCTSLASVTIEGPIEKIEESAFNGCTGLKTLTLPAGIKKISKKAFEGCTAIERINVPAKKADYYKKRLPESLHGFIVELPEEKKAKKK